MFLFFFFSSRRRHTRFDCDWSSDVCSSDLPAFLIVRLSVERAVGLCPKGVYGLALGGAFAGLAPGTRGGSACRCLSGRRKVTRVSRPERTSTLCSHSDPCPLACARTSEFPWRTAGQRKCPLA